MLKRNWVESPNVVFSVNSGAVEDFSVIVEKDHFRAFFTSGDTLQNQRLCTAVSDSPFGPFNQVEMSFPTRGHTRLYRNRIDSKRRIVTQVWPGLPKAGIWIHTDLNETLSYRELLIAPEFPYTIAAANPGIFVNPDGDIDLAWEGRDENVFWYLYTGALHPDGSITVDKKPIRDGANPSYMLHEGIVYLYFSKWNGKGFDTCVMTQPLNG
jgi:hypothetical protein